MLGIEWLTDAVLTFVARYGMVALFAFMLCETSMLFPFAPSEIVLPFAAALLVTDPLSFALFVGVATLGGTVGSVIAYYLFGQNGEYVLRRWGRYVRISDADVERGQRWFRRWGESSVFWGRVLPIVRSLISIPAGIAEMDVRKFTLYSAVGVCLFVTGVTTLVYTGMRADVVSTVVGLLASTP